MGEGSIVSILVGQGPIGNILVGQGSIGSILVVRFLQVASLWASRGYK